MTETSRKDLIKHTWAAVESGDLGALDRIAGAAYRRISASHPNGQTLGEVKASISEQRRAFPALTLTLDDMIEEGDRLAYRWHGEGRHEGPFFGVPATHRTVSVSGAGFARFDGDLLVEEYVTWDPFALLSALGIIPVGGDR